MNVFWNRKRSSCLQDVSVMEVDNGYWMRIHVKSSKRRKTPSSVTYVTHFRNTRYLVVTAMKTATAKYMLQVTCQKRRVIQWTFTLCGFSWCDIPFSICRHLKTPWIVPEYRNCPWEATVWNPWRNLQSTKIIGCVMWQSWLSHPAVVVVVDGTPTPTLSMVSRPRHCRPWHFKFARISLSRFVDLQGSQETPPRISDEVSRKRSGKTLFLASHIQRSYSQEPLSSQQQCSDLVKLFSQLAGCAAELDCQIVCEDESEMIARNSLLDEQFGSFVQPTLEKYEFKVSNGRGVLVRLFLFFSGVLLDGKMTVCSAFVLQLETTFKGIQYAPRMAFGDDLFECRVKFEGRNVLEGIRELGESGIAEVPMPKHMRRIPTLGRSILVLRDKKRVPERQSLDETTWIKCNMFFFFSDYAPPPRKWKCAPINCDFTKRKKTCACRQKRTTVLKM